MANFLDKLINSFLANKQKRQEFTQSKKDAGLFTISDYINQAKRNIGQSMSAPFRKAPIAGIELAAKTQNITPEQRSGLDKLQQLFGSQQEQQQVSTGIQEKPGKTLGKIAAGQAAYFVPGGAQNDLLKLLSKSGVVKGILPAAARIASATGGGALAGYGTSEEGKEAESTKRGAITSAVISTGFEALGALRGLFPKIEKGGDKIVRRSQSKIFGKPKQKYGGMKLYDKMDDVGIRSNNIENMADDSLSILNKEGNKLREQIDDLASNNVRLDVEDVIGELETKIANTKSVAARKPLERVLSQIKQDFGGQTSMMIDDFYQLKQNYGGLGKWTPGSGTDKTVADVYEDVYMSMNDVLDRAFETTGKTSLKALNDKISTAINALDFVNTQAANKLGSAPLALDEIIAGTGGFIAGGPVGAGAGSLGIKAATSPKVQMIAGKGLQNLGASFGGQPLIPQPLQQILSTGVAGATQQTQDQGQIMQEPQVKQQIDIKSPQFDRTQLDQEKQNALAVIDRAEAQSTGATGGLTGAEITPQMAAMAQILLPAKEAAKIKGAFDIQQSAAKTKSKAEEGNTAINALDQLESLYFGKEGEKSLSIGEKSVGLSGLLKRAETTGKKAFDQEYVDRLQGYKSSQSFLLGILNQAREAGVLNEGEYNTMVDNMPNEYTTDKQAKTYFGEVKKFLKTKNLQTDQTQTGDIQALMQMLGQ